MSTNRASFTIRRGNLQPVSAPEEREVTMWETPAPSRPTRVLSGRRRVEADILRVYPDVDVETIFDIIEKHFPGRLPPAPPSARRRGDLPTASELESQ